MTDKAAAQETEPGSAEQGDERDPAESNTLRRESMLSLLTWSEIKATFQSLREP